MLEPDKAEEWVEAVIFFDPVLFHFFLVCNLESRFLTLRNDLVEQGPEFLALGVRVLVLRFFVALIRGLFLFLRLVSNPPALSFPQLLLSFTRSFRLWRGIGYGGHKLLVFVPSSLATICLHWEFFGLLEVILELQIIILFHVYRYCGFLGRR